MPTLKQKAAVLEITANHVSVAKAMERAGYAKNTLRKPKNLTDSDGFKELMLQMGIDDSKLLTVLNDGLQANKVISARNAKEANAETDDFIEIPDHPTRHKFLETGLKLRGFLVENKQGNITQINIGNDEVSNKLRTKFTSFMEGETLD